MTTKHYYSLALALILTFSSRADAAPVVTIQNSGDSGNRIDIAIAGDGYLASQQSKYQSDVNRLVSAIFSQEPFKEYRRYFNVHRIDVISSQSGASHPEWGVQRTTAFGARYNCSGIQRLICVSNTFYFTQSLPPDKLDIKVVLVNDSTYGGSGGGVAVVSTHSLATEILLHELGHSFAGLADEYDSNSTGVRPVCTIEPREPNLTLSRTLPAIKWNRWILPSTRLPTLSSAYVGIFPIVQGCLGKFRPTYSSKMRTPGGSYGPVNMEQFIRRFYNRVSPIDSSSPDVASVQLRPGERQLFRVAKPSPQTHALSVAWFLDGKLVGLADELALDAASVSPGPHTLRLQVSDSTPWVRSDPEGLLVESRTWNVTTDSIADRVTTATP